MIYTVTLNPSLDYMVSVDEFKTGALNRTSKEEIFPGGKGINVSVMLKNLGYESVALGFIAGFTGAEIERLLKEQDIKTDFIHVANGCSRINVKVRSDTESEINGRGPEITAKDMDSLFARLWSLKSGDILVLSGSVPPSMQDTAYRDILERLNDKKVLVTVDGTKNLLRNTLKYRPFLIKPNKEELAEIYGVKLKKPDEVIEYGRRLQGEGAKNVLVSMGSEGAVLIAEDGSIISSKAPKGELINSVGAGDSMVAGFLAGYLKNNNYKDAFCLGLAAGSASAFSKGFATKPEIDLILSKIKASCVTA